ncbi:hypothetical protein Tco_0444507 [Tanacetum coccineum]
MLRLCLLQYKQDLVVMKPQRVSGRDFLKQMNENFSALSIKSLDSIFNRLQKIVSQLSILGENISQEDLNLKILRSLPSEWNTHVVVWRNKPELDTMSFDDLYNNFKIVLNKMLRNCKLKLKLNIANTQVSPASTQVSIASTQDLEQIHEDDIEENGFDLVGQLAIAEH